MTVRTTLQDLIPNTNYVVRVRALNETSASEWSIALPFTTITDTSNPTVPANVTWVSTGDSFHAEWDAVTVNLAGNPILLTRYDVQLVAGAMTRVVQVAPGGTGNKVTFDLPFEENRVLFGGTPQPAITMSVRAAESHGLVGAYSTGILATNPAPAAPTGVTVSAGVDSLDISWTAPADTDLIGYNVYTGSTAGFTPSGANRIFTGNALRFTYTTTTYSTQYFKVRAVDKFNQESVDSSAASGTPNTPFIVDTTAPATPTSLSATITNNANGIGATAAVTWVMTSPPSDLAGYNLRYRPVGSTPYEYMYGIDSGVLAATVNYLQAFTNYEFQIQAFDFSSNKSAFSSTFTATSPSNAAPANVTGLISTPSINAITYQWNAVADTDIKNYEVTFSTSPTFASGNITYFTGTSTTLTVSGLAYATTYYARVRAVDISGNTSAAFSSTDTETTGGAPGSSDGSSPSSSPNAPNVLGGLSYLYITWTPVTNNDPVTYEVHLDTTTGFTPSGATKVTEVMATSAIVDVLPGTTTPLSYGTTYYVKLIAKDRDGAAAPGTQGSGQISKVASTDVTSIGADLIVPGSGFINNLVINSGGSIQSSDYSAGTTGFRLNTTGGLELNTGSVKADTLTAGTIGSSTGTIQVAAGAVINMNGGYLKSNTYTGTSAASNPSGAGFYLGNDGLRIDQGTITASALTTGTISSGTITLGASGSIVAGSWTINNSGISIPNGAINAAALNIQQGENIVPPAYADFEWDPSWYTGKIAYVSGSGAVVSTDFKYNTQSLQWTNINAANAIDLSSSQTAHNMLFNPSTTYLISVWAMVKTGSAGVTLGGGIRHNITGPTNQTTSGTAVGSAAIPATSTWTRVTLQVTSNAAALGPGHVFFTHATAGTTVYLDGVQVEEKLTNSQTASNWMPPSQTTIDGGMIRTGSIQSTATTVVNGSTIPVWSIPMTGAASFANLSVRGNAVVGLTGDAAATTLSSANYVQGSMGWQLRSNGTGELRQLDVNSLNGNAIRAGTISASAIKTSTMSADISISGSFQTVVGTTSIDLNTTNASATVTTTSGTFYPDDVGADVFGDNIPDGASIVSYTNATTVVISVNATATASDPNGQIIRGRQVVIDSSGVRLVTSNGLSTINLPTDPAQPASFTGAVIATQLSVSDNFVITGTNNAIGNNSSLNISPGTYVPSAAPSIDFGYGSRVLTNSDGSTHSPSGSGASQFYYDPTNNLYYYAYSAPGMWLRSFNAPGHAGTTYQISQDFSLNSNLIPYGLTADASKFYFLCFDWITQSYRLYSATRSSITAGTGISLSFISTWTNVDAAGNMVQPVIHAYGGNLYVATVRDDTNRIVMQKFTGITTASGSLAFQSTKDHVGDSVAASFTVGKFDYDGINVFSVVGLSGDNKLNKVYLVDVGGSSFIPVNGTDFPSPGPVSSHIGTVYRAATTDTNTGIFQTLGNAGRLYDYTALGKTSGGTTVTAYQKWRNNGSGGGTVAIGPAGPSTTVSFIRRSQMTFTSQVPIPNIGGNSPNAVTFYAGIDSGTQWRYPEQGTGVISATYLAFQTSNASGTSTVMASGTPAAITNGSGLTLGGDGSILASSLKLGGVGATMSGFNYGIASGTTDANGMITISHGLGATPTSILLTSQNRNYGVNVASPGASTFQVRFVNADVNSLITSTSVVVYWMALL